jgi:hypothetical protein
LRPEFASYSKNIVCCAVEANLVEQGEGSPQLLLRLQKSPGHSHQLCQSELRLRDTWQGTKAARELNVATIFANYALAGAYKASGKRARAIPPLEQLSLVHQSPRYAVPQQ